MKKKHQLQENYERFFGKLTTEASLVFWFRKIDDTHVAIHSDKSKLGSGAATIAHVAELKNSLFSYPKIVKWLDKSEKGAITNEKEL